MQSIHIAHLVNGVRWRTRVAMARFYRRALPGVPFVGITGSCAKTTTKHLLAGIMSGHFPVACNPGSKNRTVSLAKTILRTKKRGICIQELGASSAGSLDAMIGLFRPTVAVVTNIMRDHYSAFRSLDAIAVEKSKLVSNLPDTGTAILNEDDPRVAAMKALANHTITFGRADSADLRAHGFESAWPGTLNGHVFWEGRRYTVTTRLLGEHWVTAVLAAMAAALSLGLSMREIVSRLPLIDPPNRRYSTERLPNGATVICDDFKSPMHAIQPALEFLKSARSARKIIVIGHISDYSGSSSRKYKVAATKAIDICEKVLLVNRFASPKLETLSDGSHQRVHCFRYLEDVKEFLGSYLKEGDLVLLKGIRKMDHLERLFMAFMKDVGCWKLACGRQLHCRQCPERHGVEACRTDGRQRV